MSAFKSLLLSICQYFSGLYGQSLRQQQVIISLCQLHPSQSLHHLIGDILQMSCKKGKRNILIIIMIRRMGWWYCILIDYNISVQVVMPLIYYHLSISAATLMVIQKKEFYIQDKLTYYAIALMQEPLTWHHTLIFMG